MKKYIGIASTIIFLFISFWLGEAGNGLFQIYPYIIGLIGIIAIPSLIYKKWRFRVLSGFVFLVLYAAAFYMGDVSFYRTYNTCIKQAERVRTALSEFKYKNGNYPDKLDELNMPLPCSRCLRGTILEFESTGSNYKIWFKDWLVVHLATDEEPFSAYK